MVLLRKKGDFPRNKENLTKKSRKSEIFKLSQFLLTYWHFSDFPHFQSVGVIFSNAIYQLFSNNHKKQF